MSDDDEDDEVFEPHPFFSGHCTCEHEREDHSWGECGVDGCECEAGWEE